MSLEDYLEDDAMEDLIDLIQLQEICRHHKDWEAAILPGERGIFIGTYADLNKVITKLRCEERESYG